MGKAHSNKGRFLGLIMVRNLKDLFYYMQIFLHLIVKM